MMTPKQAWEKAVGSHPARFPTLEAMAAPGHRVLAEFLHGSSPDPGTRTIAATSLLLTLWQVMDRALSSHPPSAILLNAGGAERDPIDLLAGRLASAPGRAEPVKGGTGTLAGATPEIASRAMVRAVRTNGELGPPTPLNTSRLQPAARSYRDAAATAFGTGATRAYTAAWHEELGLVTGEHETALLRLDTAGDRDAFRRDVLWQPGRLIHPQGPGTLLHKVRKAAVVSGSLDPASVDTNLIHGTLNLGLPFFVLPHLAGNPLKVANLPSLTVLSRTLSITPMAPADPPTHLPRGDWWDRHHRGLRSRLHHLPSAFDFAVQRAIRELPYVCQSVACGAARGEAGIEEIAALMVDLHALALRGIALGIAGLGWHAVGFDPGCPRSTALKLIGELRSGRSMSAREVQRCARLPSAAQRDTVLARLTGEGLVKRAGRYVAAVELPAFVASLHARAEFPMPEPFRPEAAGKKTATKT